MNVNDFILSIKFATYWLRETKSQHSSAFFFGGGRVCLCNQCVEISLAFFWMYIFGASKKQSLEIFGAHYKLSKVHYNIGPSGVS